MAEDPKPTVDGHPMPTVQSDLPTTEVVLATIRGDAAPVTSAPPAMPPARYELGREIARGGMGRVVEATDTTLGRVIALKEALSMDEDSLRRFARETRITARLEHPAIVPVHDAGIGPNGAPYYVMRKIGGRPLESLVATGETLAQRLALVPHIVAAANAIAHAHERGIVHRDIKPSNILVGELGETIVIDWGLAKVIDEPDDTLGPMPVLVDPDDSLKTRAGIVYGTPGFMAPEQLRGKQVDPRCDVYALGATLYHLLSRKPPHHAATADAMMKAAVLAPPMPIGELVAGIPPELSTIIDKALAHDPDERYQDARALAEDLNRFLTGQLVASHHYTPAQKLRRFVKKNKVPVIAVTAAVLALLVGGVIAYVRISNARDRADAAAEIALREKAIAEDNNERLTLGQAWIHAVTNPTLAIAMVKPLAGKHWREVRAIAAAARAAGVAWSLPASPSMSSLEMSRDGRSALGAGDDGVVRLYDLGKRTAQTVAEMKGKVTARFADDERKVVLWQDKKLTVIDRAGGARRDIPVPTAIHALELVGITAYWTDTAGALWRLDLAGTEPLQLALDQKALELSPSPDGHWIALVGERDLLLFDRTQPAEPPLTIAAGHGKGVDWSSDGEYLVALVDQRALLVHMIPDPRTVRELTVGERYFVAYSDEQVFTIGPTGVAVLSRDTQRPRRQLVGAPVGLAEGRGNTMIAGSAEGIEVLSDRGDHLLSIPAGHLSAVVASAHSPFVLGAIEDRLVVWNLDELEPQAIAQHATTAKFIGDSAVIATFVDGPAQWIDLATGQRHPLGAWPAITAAADAPGGQLAAIVDLAHQAKLIAPDKPPVDLDGDADTIAFTSDHELLIGTLAGTIALLDASSGKRTLLLDHRAPLIHIALTRTSPVWISALFADRTLWRQRIDGGRPETTVLPQKPTSPLFVGADGTVMFAIDRALMVWSADGTVGVHATLPKPITELGNIGTTKLVAFSDAGDPYLVDVAHANQVSEILDRSLGRTAAWMSAESGLMVVLNRGALEMLDPLVDHRQWTLASAPGISYTSPQLSAGGRHVLAQTASSLLVWTLALPEGPEATAAWLDRMSNAVTGSGAKSLGWR